MDGFTAFILYSVFICGLAFSAGKYMPQMELSKECFNKHEIVIKNTVFSCKPTHALNNGMRIPLGGAN